MTVKIVTDSLSDIVDGVSDELGITVVPLYVRFGEKVYRDRIEITTDEFYHRLVNDDVLPTTTQPSPGDFLEVFNKLAKETDEILVITVSSKLSGTYQSALQAKSMVEGKCRIEIVDSETVIMGLGLIVLSVAKAARDGAGLDELVELARGAMPRSHAIMSFDTLKYLAKGGRIGRAQGLLGSLLSFKPILTVKEGVVSPVTKVRTKAAGMEYLCNFVAGFPKIEELAVEFATTPEAADELVKRISSLFPEERIYRATVSPVIGTYTGPNVLSVSVLTARE
ncbi:MAG: DegV family protein [Dehalococcoidales bacterium]